MAPHGANLAEDLTPEIAEVFRELKRQGKVRFLGLTSHNDPAGVLRAATAAGHYDVTMLAYNVINGNALDEPIRQAAGRGLGVIAMKAAHAVATHHKRLQPIPDWRVAKVDRIVPGDRQAAAEGVHLGAAEPAHRGGDLEPLGRGPRAREPRRGRPARSSSQPA